MKLRTLMMILIGCIRITHLRCIEDLAVKNFPHICQVLVEMMFYLEVVRFIMFHNHFLYKYLLKFCYNDCYCNYLLNQCLHCVDECPQVFVSDRSIKNPTVHCDNTLGNYIYLLCYLTISCCNTLDNVHH